MHINTQFQFPPTKFTGKALVSLSRLKRTFATGTTQLDPEFCSWESVSLTTYPRLSIFHLMDTVYELFFAVKTRIQASFFLITRRISASNPRALRLGETICIVETCLNSCLQSQIMNSSYHYTVYTE